MARRHVALIALALMLPGGVVRADTPPDHAADLIHLVKQDCGACHGMTRKGGLGSPITAEALSGADPEGIAAIILDGIPGTAMPPWRPLMTEADALWIANYLLTEPAE